MAKYLHQVSSYYYCLHSGCLANLVMINHDNIIVPNSSYQLTLLKALISVLLFNLKKIILIVKVKETNQLEMK